jgi:hypothetical protein
VIKVSRNQGTSRCNLGDYAKPCNWSDWSEWRREEGRKRKPRGPAALGQAVGRNSVGYSWSILNASQYLVHADDRSVKVVDWWSKRTCIVKACCVYRVCKACGAFMENLQQRTYGIITADRRLSKAPQCHRVMEYADAHAIRTKI